MAPTRPNRKFPTQPARGTTGSRASSAALEELARLLGRQTARALGKHATGDAKLDLTGSFQSITEDSVS